MAAKKQGYDAKNINGIMPEETLANEAVGLLSRTIIPSTTIRWILPARIRHQDHNDVVFISENFIQLCELLPSRLLANVSARLDLGCRILAARVVSRRTSSSFLDLVVKQEHHQDKDLGQATPPQILLLALDSCEIAFVYAEDIAANRIRFRSAKKKLSPCHSSLGQYGRHLAVDSRSGTVAISPAYGQFALFRIKPLPELCEEIAALDPSKPHTFSPLQEERFIPVNGLVLKLEFLLSPSQGQAKSVLALLIASTSATGLFLYSWQEDQPLTTAKLEKCGPYKLPEIDRLPLMMIPSSQNASFTLVTESGLSVYDDVLSSSIRVSHIDIAQEFPPKFLGSCRSPLWVQWAKPPRHSGYRMTNDDFVLAREDGHLEYFEIKHYLTTKVNTRYRVGSLGINLDSAFAILDAPQGHGADIYVVGGDMNDGAVYHTRARDQAESFQTIMNLAPIRDMLILDSKSHDPQEKRVFVCSGRGEGHATVAELRQGLEARIGFEVEEVGAPSATRLWILPSTDADELTILVSLPFQTTALQIGFETSVIEAIDDRLADQGFVVDEQTLAFSATEKNLFLQITPNTVAITTLISIDGPFLRPHVKSPVLLAAIHRDGLMFATINIAAEGFEVAVGSISTRDETIRLLDYPVIYSTEAEPSSMILFDLDGKDFLVIGTILGTIDVLKIERDQGPFLMMSYSITNLYSGLAASAVCSLAYLEDSNSGPPAITCGTRMGWFLGLTVLSAEPMVCDEDDSGQGAEETSNGPNILSLQPIRCQRIGQTAVELISDPANRSSALVLCNSEVYRLTFTPSAWTVKFPVTRVWWTKVAKPAFDQPQVNAVVAMTTQYSSSRIHDLESRLVCLAGDDLLVASLARKSTTVPRRIMVSGDPSKVIFSQSLNKLVVAIDQVELVADADPRRPLRRVIRPGIQLLDPNTSASDSAGQQFLKLGQAGSRIKSLLSWTPTNGTTTLAMIVVGFYVDGPNTAHCDGRLMCFTVTKDAHGNGRLDKMARPTIRFVGCPIYSLAPHGDSSLVVCGGTELFVRTLDVSTMKWTQTAVYRLSSPALAIHVSGQWIYAATARHSLKILEVSEDGALILRAEDTRTKAAVPSSTHFLGSSEGGMLATSSNKGSRVLGLSKQNASQTSIQWSFEVSLPLMITCVREISKDDPCDKAGKKYFGSTYDGSLYEFTILGQREWECLDFIARLAWKKLAGRLPRQRLLHASRRKVQNSLHRQEERGRRIRPSDMHVNGDKVAELVQCGPEEFRRLLVEGPPCTDILDSQRPGAQDQKSLLSQLAELGGPVFGTGMNDEGSNRNDGDIVLSAFRWMQKLVGDLDND